MRRNSKTKYGSDSCHCNQGHIHQSRKEARYCDSLGYLKRAKEIKDYEIQKKFDLSVNGVHICNYYVDFLVTLMDGTQQAEEVKGFSTDTWLIKKKLFEALYPKVKYVVVR